MASDVAIQAISFLPDGGFDISYAEQRDITPHVVVVKQLMVTSGVLDDEIDEIRMLARELVDLALERMNAAPERISRR